MQLTVIICTHNPRVDYLARTMDALRAQTLPLEHWELLLIDNASQEPLADQWDLRWHPHARHVREDELGLTPARLRGMREAQGECLVFVDDDNVMQADYLERILEIRAGMPFIEVLGSGKITGEFEIPLEERLKPYITMLALREVKRDTWSNNPLRCGLYPCGAGLCVTRKVSQEYIATLQRDPRRKQFDRRGSVLTAGGDDDICFTAGSLGVGVGMFKALVITHLIPKSRMNEAYLLRLAEATGISGRILAYLWHMPMNPPPVRSLRWRFGYWRMRRKMPPTQRLFADALVRAEDRAWEAIQAMQAAEKDATDGNLSQ